MIAMLNCFSCCSHFSPHKKSKHFARKQEKRLTRQSAFSPTKQPDWRMEGLAPKKRNPPPNPHFKKAETIFRRFQPQQSPVHDLNREFPLLIFLLKQVLSQVRAKLVGSSNKAVPLLMTKKSPHPMSESPSTRFVITPFFSASEKRNIIGFLSIKKQASIKRKVLF